MSDRYDAALFYGVNQLLEAGGQEKPAETLDLACSIRRKREAAIRKLSWMIVTNLVLAACTNVAAPATSPPAPTVAATPTAVAPATPTAAPSVSPPPSASAGPGPAESPGPTPVAALWTTTADVFAGKNDQQFDFACPPAGYVGAVWGTNVYSADSSVCTAAVHAGLIDLASGGNVKIVMLPGRGAYRATDRNGVSSRSAGAYGSSFSFVTP